MEVHHHSHSPSIKNWKSYIWEFIMLFLAVFCGFYAEFQLEHKIEREREVIYIQSMIEDLEKDTVNLAYCINVFQKKDLQLDTVLKLYHQISQRYNESLHRNMQACTGYPDFIYSDRTMEQLKYSGAMRLIRNQAALKGIVNYDWNVRDINGVDIPSLDLSFFHIGLLLSSLIDEESLITDKATKSKTEMEEGSNIYLFTSDKAVLGTLNNHIRTIQATYKMIANKERLLKDEAAKLIILLKKEYDLTDK